ncbi:hypothetical protein [Desulfosoma caldarium]|uniref:Uncharacterized protein n=1 Tax=Desulfosoma caldarium TaxID=610254 RepID=A0A3N1ULF2_9BACT|nr:hypothetical protein [Desulfosoma caldarium]ROQ92055.1 hypothetical protein EDC27_1727 [Desulfosoma caldarium]
MIKQYVTEFPYVAGIAGMVLGYLAGRYHGKQILKYYKKKIEDLKTGISYYVLDEDDGEV